MTQWDLSRVTSFEYLQTAVYQNAYEHGFWDAELNIPEKIALIHSEASEALEDYRSNNMETTFLESGKPVGFPSELADIVIRVMDLCEHLGIDLAEEIVLKHEYNKSRPFMHGKAC